MIILPMIKSLLKTHGWMHNEKFGTIRPALPITVLAFTRQALFRDSFFRSQTVLIIFAIPQATHLLFYFLIRKTDMLHLLEGPTTLLRIKGEIDHRLVGVEPTTPLLQCMHSSAVL